MRRQPRFSEPGPSLEACAGVIIGVTLTYLGAEAMLPGPFHPVHWGLTLAGGVVGYIVGQVVHRCKSDDPPWRNPRSRR
jgi:hypothetical protein